MKTIACDHCAKASVPQNETIQIEHSVYCEDCLKTHFPLDSHLEGKHIEKVYDPIVCAFCENDFGSKELETMGGIPSCEPCTTKARSYPFPMWVKAFMLGIAAIVLFSTYWNFRFFEAYEHLNQSWVASDTGNFEAAYIHIETASEQVPENHELKTLASYFKGVYYLQNDKASKAYPLLLACEQDLPYDYDVSRMVRQARISMNFDDADYEGFLSGTQEQLELDKSIPLSWASVASALACIYATTDNDSFRLESLRHIMKAKELSSYSEEIQEYTMRINYRLQSKEIITTEEFYAKFPNGWEFKKE